MGSISLLFFLFLFDAVTGDSGDRLCLSAMNQSREHWCHSVPGLSTENPNDEPYVSTDDGGDCLPYSGIWTREKRWTPVNDFLELKPAIIEGLRGYRVAGYFRLSCTGVTNQQCSSDCTENNDDDDDSMVLLRFRFWGEVNCSSSEDASRFGACPKAMTGCLVRESAEYFEFLDGDITFRGGKKFRIIHRFMGGKRPVSPVIFGIGGNLHNNVLGIGFWFQAREINGYSFFDGDINFDVHRCPEQELPLPDLVECSSNPMVLFNTSRTEEKRCAYEYNPASLKSNHAVYLKKERRRMVPAYTDVTSFRGSFKSTKPYEVIQKTVLYQRALSVSSFTPGIDGNFEVSGNLVDISNRSYGLLFKLLASKGRSYYSCSDTGNLENPREEPYFCLANGINYERNKHFWDYYGELNGILSQTKSDNEPMASACRITQEGFASARYGLEASGKYQPFSRNRYGFSAEFGIFNCSRSLAHLEGSRGFVNIVLDSCAMPGQASFDECRKKVQA